MDGSGQATDDPESTLLEAFGRERRQPGTEQDESGGVTVDGRSLRRERNRDAVIVALLELIREGRHAPSTHEIADRAGVSHRSVFRYFDDLDDLVRAAIDHEIVEVLPMAVVPNPGAGPIEFRIDTILDIVLRIYDYTHSVGRVARARSLAIPAIDEGLTAANQLLRSRLAEQFASEIEQRDEADRRNLLDAVQFTLSFDSFDFHRRRLGRSNDEIREVWRAVLVALLVR